MPQITLQWNEVSLAAWTGMQRQMKALAASRPDRHGFTGAGWSEHIEGACGEVAAAKALGVYWTPTVNTFTAGGDVGALQVRTRSRDDYELLIRPQDRDEDVFILVRGKSPSFSVVGWIRGRDAKRAEWMREHGGRPPAYFVPDAALQPIEALARPHVPETEAA